VVDWARAGLGGSQKPITKAVADVCARKSRRVRALPLWVWLLVGGFGMGTG